jgi:CYTH domain-containing protein
LNTSIDPEIARALGFPRAHYTAIERERRWPCREVPRERVRRTEAITDLYVTDARLRLLEALGELAGLVLAEAEFKTPEELSAFPCPRFAIREVTDDARFTGASLARHGIPD